MQKTMRVNRSAVTQPNKPTVAEIIATMRESAEAWRDNYKHARTGRVEDPDALRVIACLRAGIKLLRQMRKGAV